MKTVLRPLSIVVAGTVAGSAEDAPKHHSLKGEGGAQVALWQATPNPNKPYIAQLFAPGEKPLALLDDSPPDHFHHHGLMFALSVDETDFWTEKVENAGSQKEVGSLLWPDQSGCTQKLRWTAPDGTALLDEIRRIQVRSGGEGEATVHWLDWESTLSPATGRKVVKMGGAHYFGLGMRLKMAWAGKGTFSWQDAAGQKVVRGTEKLTGGRWCAVRCLIDGQPVTVLMIDHPGNARPVRWFTMTKPFCYLSATLGLQEESAPLRSGESWTLRYGLAVLANDAGRSRLEKLATQWRGADPLPKKQPATKQ